MKKILAVVALCIAPLAAVVAAQPTAEEWRIGPVIKGRNYSVGMPATMQSSREGPTFSFPREGDGHVHYVSLRTGPIDGARTIGYAIA